MRPAKYCGHYLNLHIVYLAAFSASQGKLIDFGKTDINSIKCAVFISSDSVTHHCVFSGGFKDK